MPIINFYDSPGVGDMDVSMEELYKAVISNLYFQKFSMFIFTFDSTAGMMIDDAKTIAFLDELFNCKSGKITLAFSKIDMLEDPEKFKQNVKDITLPRINKKLGMTFTINDCLFLDFSEKKKNETLI